MKKLFFLAATAMLFAACTSDELALQEENGVAGVQSEAVGFDVYVPAATNATRAGLEGTMTTNRIQRAEGDGGGFGVYAFLTEDAVAAAGGGANATAYAPTDPSSKANVPNYMVNEKILWNATNQGWYYNPLKYWPNETDNDSQTTPAIMEGSTPKHLDRLTFFAYAPYVSAGSGTTGITYITDNAGLLNTVKTSDPTLSYVSTDATTDVNPNNYVDLLWGVAPSGGLSYTAVNGTTVSRAEGKPLIDMIKPDVNTSMKFLFNHSLARFGINVVAAVDQVAPGGKLDANTKITVNSLKISGPFGITGNLNLNNGDNASIANWTKIQTTAVTSDTKAMGSTQDITVTASGTNKAIAPNLRYAGAHTFSSYSAQDVVGVTTAKQDLLGGSTKWFNKLAAVPTYDPAKIYYSNAEGTEATASCENGTKKKVDGLWGFLYTWATDHFVKQAANENAPAFPSDVPTLYFVKATAHTVTTAGIKPSTIGTGIPVYEIDDAANDGSGTSKVPTFTYNSTLTGGTFTSKAVNDKVYTLEAVELPMSDIYTYPSGEYYAAERNYLYVVPTNNIAKNDGLTPTQDEALRTITLQIEYYITTEDSKISGGRTQTKNVITKTVLLPSLANGKSYMLNLVLGLTSVKVEAEVEDWKVVNVQADLPQNTAE